MRAREFIFEFDTTLSSKIKQAVASQQPQQGSGINTNPNQSKTPAPTQGTVGTSSAQQATSGGTQTPQPAGADKPGVMGSFVSGLTGGKATSVGGLVGLGAAKTMGAAGLGKTAGAIGNAMGQEPASGPAPTTQQLQTTLKQGSQIKIPGMDDFKVGKIDNTGIELTGTKLGKIKVDPKTLAGK